MVSRVTERNAVESAMDEFDQLGRDAFLEKYGFQRANRYFVKRNGRLYDSKAIYGAAHQIQFPDLGAMRSSDFSGGEQTVQGPLEALGFDFEVSPKSDDADPASATGRTGEVTSAYVLRIADSRLKKKYADLSEDERAAYVRVSLALEKLGELIQSELTHPEKFEIRTTAGFHIRSGVRGGIPKDLWVSVSPRANHTDLAGMPQLFVIVSERGIEYGFGASVSPSDFSQPTPKEAVRNAAPKIFECLPKPGSPEALRIDEELTSNGRWFFRRKHRLPPNQIEFANLNEWLGFLKSSEGKASAAGAISKYLVGDEIDRTDLQSEMSTMAKLFDALIDRDPL